ncbi:MAG: hypothetical protein AB7G15_10980 [Alphaproteobacteria bacterium]
MRERAASARRLSPGEPGADMRRAIPILCWAMVWATWAGLSAHDGYDWIRQRGYVGVDGTRCCGKDDCERIPAAAIEITPEGFFLRDARISVPYRQARPSEDGHYWLCRSDARTMRCFFAPPSSM